MRVSQKWRVHNGKSLNGWFGGIPIYGTPPYFDIVTLARCSLVIKYRRPMVGLSRLFPQVVPHPTSHQWASTGVSMRKIWPLNHEIFRWTYDVWQSDRLWMALAWFSQALLSSSITKCWWLVNPKKIDISLAFLQKQNGFDMVRWSLQTPRFFPEPSLLGSVRGMLHGQPQPSHQFRFFACARWLQSAGSCNPAILPCCKHPS